MIITATAEISKLSSDVNYILRLISTFSDWTGNPLLMCENVAVNLNRILRVTKSLLSKIQPGRKIRLSGNRPVER